MLLILLHFNVNLNVIKDEWVGNIFAMAYNPVRMPNYLERIFKKEYKMRGYDAFFFFFLEGWG